MGKLKHEGEQILHGAGLEREQDGIDAFAVERGVVHQRRERVRDGIAGHSKDAGCGVELVCAIEGAHGLGGDLAGRGLGSVGKRCEGERAAGARAEHAADEAFFAHGDAEHARGCRAVFDEAQDGEVVGEGLRGGDDLDEVGREGGDAIGGAIDGAGAGEVVEADDELGAGFVEGGAEFFELRGGGFFGRFDFEVDDLAAGACGFRSNIESSSSSEPVKPPLLGLRRQVAMAVALCSERNFFRRGSADEGEARASRRNSRKREPFNADAARANISAGVAAWMAMQIFGIRNGCRDG